MTTKFELVAFTAADVQVVRSWIPHGDALVEWAGTLYSWPLTDAQMLQHYERALPPDAICKPFKYVAASDGSMAGYVELNRIDRHHRNAALSRVIIDPSRRGLGLARPMLDAVLKVAFLELGLHRVELAVYAHNRPALRCYEGMGFVREGCLRELTRVGDSYWDEIRMSLLEHEFGGRFRSIDADATARSR